jgi:hypothetical protein
MCLSISGIAFVKIARYSKFLKHDLPTHLLTRDREEP